MAWQKAERPDDSNTLWLRKNLKKQEDWHADYRGDGKVDGRQFWIDGKIIKTKDGETVMRLKVKAKEEQKRETYNRQAEEDEEIPF